MAQKVWSRPYNLVLKCLRGLEHNLFNELVSFGFERNALVKSNGRVTVLGATDAQMYFLSYFSRLSSRVYVDLGKLTLSDKKTLFKGCESVPWSDFMSNSNTYVVSCGSLQSNRNINSTIYACQLLKDGISHHFASNLNLDPPKVELKTPEIKLEIEVDEDCSATLMVDGVGSALSSRGYRCKPNIGSIDATVAASTMYDMGYASFSDPPYSISEYESRYASESTYIPPNEPQDSEDLGHREVLDKGSIVDLFSGCGVFLIEAALLSARIPPGYFKGRFSFQKFPTFNRIAFEALRTYVEDRRVKPGGSEWESLAGKFIGIERDWEKLEASLSSSEAAGVLDLVSFSHANYLKDGLADASSSGDPSRWQYMVAQLPQMKRLFHEQDCRNSNANGSGPGGSRGSSAKKLSPERYLTLLKSLSRYRKRHFAPDSKGVLILPSFIDKMYVQESFGSKLSVGKTFSKEGVTSTSYYTV